MPSVFTPSTQTELARFVAGNATGSRQRLRPIGGRTTLLANVANTEEVCELRLGELKSLVDYPARDMTITVEAGMTVAELQSVLQQEKQRLPIDFAQPTRATIGGAVAMNASGPRRAGHGSLRDYLIGVSAVDAQGRLFHGGGRVVKNVAGYDLCKLAIGSRGTLAILTQFTFKLRPLPEAEGLIWTTFDTFAEIENALERLLVSDARPVAVEVLTPPAAAVIAIAAHAGLPTDRPVLAIGVEGTESTVAWQIEQLRREIVPFGVQDYQTITTDAASPVWAALTEFQTPADDPITFQANLRPSRAMEFLTLADSTGVLAQCHAVNGLIVGHIPAEPGGGTSPLGTLDQLRDFARTAGGNLMVRHADESLSSRIDWLGDPEPSALLMKQLKTQLDPHGLFNPTWFDVKPS